MFYRLIIIILAFLVFFPQLVQADEAYPRLANYFLKWELSEAEAIELSKWDVVILDMENQENNPDMIRLIRKLNPKIRILAYITSQEILDNASDYRNAWLRKELYSQIADDWYLRDDQGKKVINWPNTSMFNLSDHVTTNSQGYKLNEYLPHFVHEKLQITGLWDGVFYDNIWGDVAWVNGGNLDFDNNGKRDSVLVANSLWAAGTAKMLNLTRTLCGSDFIILGNGRIYWSYQSILNGNMLEAFPSFWENGGTWAGSMESYIKLPTVNAQPSVPIINVYEKDQTNYRLFRYGLTSALLGEGYYSFDYDVTSHGQTWWYDEYEVKLGTSQSSPYNLLDSENKKWQPGLWRRDFKNGVAIVNSTNKTQTFLFSKEEFEKIKGSQDKTVNNGLKINYLKIAPNDGIILFKKITAWQGSGFINGGFLRIFTPDGKQDRNGFFSYVTSLPSGSSVLVGDFLSSGENNYIFSKNGELSRQQASKIMWTVQPFAAGFKGSVSLAVGDINGDKLPEIVIGAGPGGGPQVRAFDFNGRPILNFFAYDKNFRGGVNVAVGDVNGDGKAEIITGAGPGGGPHVRYFNEKGGVLGGFFAYDENFRGGVNVAAGDINKDGKAEIITGAGPGGGPQVRYFNDKGVARGSFFAYDEHFRDGISVGFSEQNGQPEISVGIKGF
ncbi:hypothetical protein K9M09_01395 [Patescibacteria group bacterium]|nr:hypothetical protein [Patescibacteria group bacterium]